VFRIAVPRSLLRMLLSTETTSELLPKILISARKLSFRKDVTLMFQFKFVILKFALRKKKRLYSYAAEMWKASV
jgi:hypothetical protein